MKEVKTPRKPFIFYYIIVLLVLMLVNMFVMPMIREASIKKVDYNEFMNMTLNKQIKKVEIDDSQITFTDQNGTVYKTSKMDGDWGLTERLYRSGAEFTTQVQEQMSPILSFLLSWIIPIVLFSALGYYAQKKMMNKMSGGGPNMMFGMGKSNAKVYVPSEEGIRFSDVAGEDEAKENLAEIVDYLHQPSKYSEIGASMPKGVLLVGPPGTGKTMLAKAVAGEANVPFFSISGSEFVEMFVGMGASKVRDLFKQAKENLAEIVDYLHQPSKYSEIGASMPKGVLLVGPPGTGKTMLAKAVAGEANVPFFSISGSEFVEMFVGMGASKVRDLFKQAKEKAPCIVFIDEIDAIGKKRDGHIGGNDEREQTLNQLLTEMDGFEGNNGVIILAATNRPESLDPALTRPGRFDRRVPVELPDLVGREAILRVHSKKTRLADNVDLHAIARMAAGASGAELANIINEGALRAVRNGRRIVTQADLEESVEVVIAGYQKKNAVLSPKEKMTVAYHEIGHALVAAKQTNSAPVQKITIIPRTSGALGYTMQVEQQDKYLMTKEEIQNKIATLTGGRAAEEIVTGTISTGASNDIEQATKLARAMITRYGMTDEFDMVAMETVNNQYLGGDASLACSADTQKKIDEKVVEVVKAQHKKALDILNENKDKLHELANFLYEKETITGEEFMRILES